MKSIPQIAEELNISTSTIREYLKSFKEFFSDPVEHEGVKEYPDDTSDLISQIYDYYQTSGLTKEEIREKLEGDLAKEDQMGAAPSTVTAAPVDMGQFNVLGEKIDKLTQVIELLITTLSGGGSIGAGAGDPLGEINAQITEILEISKESEPQKIEEHVKDADGTLIFSYGKLTTNAEKALKFGKTYKKPWLHIDLETEKNPDKTVRSWLEKSDIKVLHVAGRNVSKVPKLKKTVDDIISSIVNQ